MRLFVVIGMCAACAAGGGRQVKDAPPPQDVAPADRAAMNERLVAMRDLADKAIAAAREAPGSSDFRWRRGALDVVTAMRPTFGPANAALFNERARQLDALAAAVGAGPAERDAVDVTVLDAFVDDLAVMQATLTSRGFTVRVEPTNSAALGWLPPTPGRVITVEDSSREIEWHRPYAQLSPQLPPTQRVHPLLAWHLFPPRPMTSGASMVTREQPGSLVGATAHALVFTQQQVQTRLADDGQLRASVLEVLFPGDVDGRGATGRGGTDSERPHAVVESQQAGMEMSVTVRPLDAR